ncbi:MAG: M15 family metallopeptidase [Candidatus Babeliales bacterium]
MIKKISVFLLFLFISFFECDLKLVEVIRIIPNICLDVKYATKNNFTGQIVYASSKCFLEEEVVKNLKNVQKELNKIGLGLKIFDGYRPLSVQKKFWLICPDENFVANPKKGSKHNRGVAVDLTLINLVTKKELVMPSKFDDFTSKAFRNYDKMSSEAAKNCRFLENILKKYGFIGLKTEWWHFDFKNWRKYPILDIDFEKIE